MTDGSSELEDEAKRAPAYGLIGALMLAQAVLLAIGIGDDSLWLDEVMSLTFFSAVPWDVMTEHFAGFPEQHPLYYLLLRGWLVFGDSEGFIRAMSALTTLAATPLLYLLARRVGGEWVGRVSAAILVFSPFFIYYGQEARPYSLVAFFSIASTLALVIWRTEGSRRASFAYVALSILGVYTHFFFIYLMLAQLVGAVFLACDDRLGAGRSTLLSQIVVGVAYLPWAIFLLVNFPTTQTWKGVEHVLFGLPYTAFRFTVGYAEVVANYQWQSNVLELARQDAPVIVLAFVVFAVATLGGVRACLARPRTGRATLALVLVPVLGALATSVVTILVGERYLIVSFPYFVILVAMGLEEVRRSAPRWAGVALITGFVLVNVKTLSDHYLRADFAKEQWREVVELVQEERAPGEPIMVVDRQALNPFRYYHGAIEDAPMVMGMEEDLPDMARYDSFWVIGYNKPPGLIEETFSSTHEAALSRLFPMESGIWTVRLQRRAEGDPPPPDRGP